MVDTAPTFIGGGSPESTNSSQQNIVGGAVKASSILGGIGGIAGAASAIPGAAVITAPIAAIAGIGSAIAKLFGGSLTTKEMEIIGHIKNRVDFRNKKGNLNLSQTINRSSI